MRPDGDLDTNSVQTAEPASSMPGDVLAIWLEPANASANNCLLPPLPSSRAIGLIRPGMPPCAIERDIATITCARKLDGRIGRTYADLLECLGVGRVIGAQPAQPTAITGAPGQAEFS
jgi:hypothetical protein